MVELKNSIRSAVLAVLLIEPLIVVLLPLLSALIRTGKFCRPFAPVSASPASFAFTPKGPRSMPRAPF